MPAWNRQQLWGHADAARASHARVGTSILVVGAFTVLVARTYVACVELYVVDEPHAVPVAVPSDCRSDADCALKPSLITCCGECAPLPIFEAMPRTELARLREELAGACAPADVCEPPLCSGLPEGCEARAICRRGACEVEASDACLAP